MAPESTAKTPRPGLSLYANLLDPQGAQASAQGTISRAPVVFKQPDGGVVRHDADVSVQRQQPNAASLRFQPTKRPQVSSQRPRAKPALSKFDPPNTSKQVSTSAEESTTAVQQLARTSISDWAAELDDDDMHSSYPAEKRQRGGRKKRKKNKESPIVQNWNDIYDPSRPNSYEEYQNSDEKILEIKEWKGRLYAHRFVKNRSSSLGSSSDEDDRQARRSGPVAQPSLSFAPPIDFESISPAQGVADDTTGEDVYARRLRLSRATDDPKPVFDASRPEGALPMDITQSQPRAFERATSSSHPLQWSVTNISRAPVRYNLPPPPPEIPKSEAELEDALKDEASENTEANSDEAPRSLRPGQKGFAERLMSKYGWTKGSGLGAGGTGIVNPLRVRIEKQKKKPDSEGGGFVGPGGRGKIIGSKKATSTSESEGGKWGVMSEVVVLRGMLNGLDVDAELDRAEDGGLMQEIGDECGEKYGRVERVFIDRRDASSPPVFVKFTSQLSALRAVNALEGRVFNGNAIVARFYDREKFDSGVYD